ncbi:hypothetical protein ACQRXC_14980 [Niallia taxi]|uniref:hypothetical protein n=1 Tax=Niallia taxi TaxID=2499688 RepID=UPI003F641523
MKLSETGIDNKDSVYALLKFTPFKDSFLSGNLYMNNFKRYIDMEKESGIKGVGDKYEAAHVYKNLSFKMYDSVTNELVLEGESSAMDFRLDGAEKRPVLCLFAITGELLEVVREDEEYYHTKISLPEDQAKKMISEFGDELIFINPVGFLNKVTAVLNEKDFSYRASLVKYDDYSINSSARLESYKKNDNEIYFWKDIFFENQYEYRIVITDQEIDEPLILSIGDIRDITKVFNAEEFFSGQFELAIKK